MISQQKLDYIFYISVTCLQIDHVTTKEDALQSRRLSPRSLQMKNLSDYFNVITVKLQILYTNHCQSVYITIEHTLIFQVVIYYMTHSLRLLTLYSYIVLEAICFLFNTRALVFRCLEASS